VLDGRRAVKPKGKPFLSFFYLQLAYTKRQNRQSLRTYEELLCTHNRTTRNAEKALLQSKRVKILQTQLDQLRQSYEQTRAGMGP
jgi:hypothetical protein